MMRWGKDVIEFDFTFLTYISDVAVVEHRHVEDRVFSWFNHDGNIGNVGK